MSAIVQISALTLRQCDAPRRDEAPEADAIPNALAIAKLRYKVFLAEFEALKISFPKNKEERLIAEIQEAREQLRQAGELVKVEMNNLSDIIDGRGQEELAPIIDEPDDGNDE